MTNVSYTSLATFNSTSYGLLIVDVNSGKPTLGDPYSLYHTAIQGGVISTLLLDQ